MWAIAVNAQEKPETFAIFVSGVDDAAPVAQALIKKMSVSKPFEVVGPKDDSKVVVMVSCMDRKQPDLPFICMYVSHYNGGAFKTFLGAAVFGAVTADTVANKFFASIAQDIVDNYNKVDKENLRQGLEACLVLTESKCNVPDPLQKELNAKELTLGQYIMKKRRE